YTCNPSVPPPQQAHSHYHVIGHSSFLIYPFCHSLQSKRAVETFAPSFTTENTQDAEIHRGKKGSQCVRSYVNFLRPSGGPLASATAILRPLTPSAWNLRTPFASGTPGCATCSEKFCTGDVHRASSFHAKELGITRQPLSHIQHRQLIEVPVNVR